MFKCSPETIETCFPEPSVRSEPTLELLKWLGPKGVVPSLPFRAHRHEAMIVKNAQMA